MALPGRSAAYEVPISVADHGCKNIHRRAVVLPAHTAEERQKSGMQLGSIQDVLMGRLIDPHHLGSRVVRDAARVLRRHPGVKLSLHHENRNSQFARTGRRIQATERLSRPALPERTQDPSHQVPGQTAVREHPGRYLEQVGRGSHERHGIDRRTGRRREQRRRAAEAVSHHGDRRIGPPLAGGIQSVPEIIAEVANRDEGGVVAATMPPDVDREHGIPCRQQRLGHEHHRSAVPGPTVHEHDDGMVGANPGRLHPLPAQGEAVERTKLDQFMRQTKVRGRAFQAAARWPGRHERQPIQCHDSSGCCREGPQNRHASILLLVRSNSAAQSDGARDGKIGVPGCSGQESRLTGNVILCRTCSESATFDLSSDQATMRATDYMNGLR